MKTGTWKRDAIAMWKRHATKALTLTALTAFTVTAGAVPTVDGKVSASEYDFSYAVDFHLEGGSSGISFTGGQLFMSRVDDGVDDCLFVGFIAPLSMNDNTWGDYRALDWGAETHVFEKLQKSDKWKWDDLTPEGTGAEDIKLEFDYLDDDGREALVKKAEQDDGGTFKKDVRGAFTVASSLQYNLANYTGGIDPYRKDDFDFGTEASWLYGVAYEWKVNNELIDGTLTIDSVLDEFGLFHMSPIKQGKHSDIPENPRVQDIADGGLTLMLLGMALTGLAVAKRRRSK